MTLWTPKISCMGIVKSTLTNYSPSQQRPQGPLHETVSKAFQTILANHFYSTFDNLAEQVVTAPTIAAFKQNLRPLP